MANDVKIKICGIRRMEDVEIINKYKPDYIGFIFAKSKRQVTPEQAAELIAHLNGDTKTVGVFVNAPIEEVRKIAGTLNLNAVQLHGDEDAEYISSLRGIGCEIWKAIRIRDGGDINDISGTQKLLLDKFKETEYGGSGETFDWSSVGKINTDKPIILAGGLTPENVLRGIEIFKPYAVDVSSAVETGGFKDEKKIREFINTVRNNGNEQN